MPLCDSHVAVVVVSTSRPRVLVMTADRALMKPSGEDAVGRSGILEWREANGRRQLCSHRLYANAPPPSPMPSVPCGPCQSPAPPPPPLLVIRNVLVDATRHRWRNRNGRPKQRRGEHSFKEREGKGRAAKLRSANRRCRLQTRTTTPRRHATSPPPRPGPPSTGCGWLWGGGGAWAALTELPQALEPARTPPRFAVPFRGRGLGLAAVGLHPSRPAPAHCIPRHRPAHRHPQRARATTIRRTGPRPGATAEANARPACRQVCRREGRRWAWGGGRVCARAAVVSVRSRAEGPPPALLHVFRGVRDDIPIVRRRAVVTGVGARGWQGPVKRGVRDPPPPRPPPPHTHTRKRQNGATPQGSTLRSTTAPQTVCSNFVYSWQVLF